MTTLNTHTMYTKDEIKNKLSTDVKWMERGVIVLYQRQTEDEKQTQETRHQNGVGFNGTDSRYLSWVGKYLMRGGHLSGHHIEKVGKRLPKYWGQIMDIIEEKERMRVGVVLD